MYCKDIEIFEQGDRIKTIEDGKIGTVTTEGGDDNCYVKIDGSKYIQIFFNDEIELLED